MHMLRSQHPSLTSEDLLVLIRHAIMPDEEDEGADDLAEDVALHLALVRCVDELRSPPFLHKVVAS